MPLVAAGGESALSTAQLRYDYSQLPANIQDEAADNTYAILEHVEKVGQSAYDIGMLLEEQKEILGHGHWLPWLKTELNWDERRAQAFMSIPARWPNRKQYKPIAELTQSVQQLLAAPSTPDEAVERVVAAHQNGEPVTVKRAQNIVTAVQVEQAAPAPTKNFVSPDAIVLDFAGTVAVVNLGIGGLTTRRAYDFLNTAKPASFIGHCPTGFIMDGETFDRAVSEVRGRLASELERTRVAAKATYVPTSTPLPAIPPSESPSMPAEGVDAGEDKALKLRAGNVIEEMLRAAQAKLNGETVEDWMQKLAMENESIPVEAYGVWNAIRRDLAQLLKWLED